METYVAIQDWEIAEETASGELETIDIQIETEAEALRQAQEWANKTRHNVYVSTSLRYENTLTNSVEDRGEAPGNPDPIIVRPN